MTSGMVFLSIKYIEWCSRSLWIISGMILIVFQNLRSGTTAVCALLRPTEQMLYVAWLGDSQALLVRNGEGVQVVNPHKPDRKVWNIMYV